MLYMIKFMEIKLQKFYNFFCLKEICETDVYMVFHVQNIFSTTL